MRGYLKGQDNSCIQLSTVYPVAVGRDVNCDIVLTVRIPLTIMYQAYLPSRHICVGFS